MDDLAANVVGRLLAHPVTEWRGAREKGKDTLLVRGEERSSRVSTTKAVVQMQQDSY